MEPQLLKVVNATKYPIEAFAFIQRGLDFTVRSIHGEPSDKEPLPAPDENTTRHITGKQLCMGIRNYAVEQYGMLARTVLRHWCINATEDFGHIVFAMVDAGLMYKTDEDSIEDFVGVFEFREAFAPKLILGESY